MARHDPAPLPVRRRTISLWVWLSTACTVIGVGAMLWFMSQSEAVNYQYDGQWIGKDAPDFMLTDQDGRMARLSALRGKAVLITFGFTHCPNICPTTLANLAAIYQGLPEQDRARVQVVFITVDPARDTSGAMKEYVSFYSPRFMGLTGSAEDIAKVAKEYGASYESQIPGVPVTGNYSTIIHSTYVYLINPEGQYAVLYDNDKLADHARMDRDIKHVLAGGEQ